MKIAIANDHHGIKRKNEIIAYLKSKGHEVLDFGAISDETKVDYPTYAFNVVKAILNGEAERGILLCRTGIGMSMAANRFKGIRCAKVDSVYDVKWTRHDNNANMISLNEKMNILRVKDIIDTFIDTSFSPEERHARRNGLLDNYDN